MSRPRCTDWLTFAQEQVVRLLAAGSSYRAIERERQYARDVPKMYSVRARRRVGARTNQELVAMWNARKEA